jgi:hypothetical protein
MNPFAIILPPLALLLPALAGSPDGDGVPGMDPARAAPEREAPELGLGRPVQEGLAILEEARSEPRQHQVRIRGRVVIRISPNSPAARERMMSALPRRKLAEVDHADCVSIDAIAGVQPTQDNRLLFLMRDRKVLVADLERSCTARSFYSDSYVERSDDGKLCINRDRLQSRAGANCQIDSFSRLVAPSE